LKLPFDRDRLEQRMQADHVDLILATSPQNVSYLLGGYRSHFFSEMPAIGLSRHAAAIGFPCGRPERAFYVGSPVEAAQQELKPLWVGEAVNAVWTTHRLGVVAADLIRGLRLERATIGLELPFLAADTYLALAESLPQAKIVDAVPILEHLRAVKLPHELSLLSEAADAIVDAMLATLQKASPGITTRDLAAHLAAEEIQRGLRFDYCLAAVGPGLNRTPSEVRWGKGQALSLDSGGSKSGYIGDLARMAVMGRPSRLQDELLKEVESFQAAARVAIRAGALGKEIYSSVAGARASCRHGSSMEFVAHGMGLVSHEAPRLTSTGPVPYPADHAELPLESGMVLSIETTAIDAEVGMVKVEDTVAVTDSGWVGYGDRAQGWQIVS
jgi:Xaa-Pro aminopeptidase